MNKTATSLYLNHVDLGDGTSLLFNGATMCIDLVPSAYAQRLTNGNGAPDLSFLTPDEKKHLMERGHLTDLTPEGELEEFRKLIRFVLEKDKRKKKRATLSFILTYNCNLSCSYCYQKSLAGKSHMPTMTEEFVDDLFARYLPQLFPDVPKKNIIFLLFGGEPLLPGNRKTIAKILAYAKRRAIKVSTATNATTLGSMADLIGPGKGRIQNVQVTLDGDRLLHDANRVPRSGEPTFDEMVAAVHRLVALKAHVFIRIHTHPGKLESAERLVEYLDKAKLLTNPDIEVYFAPINTFQTEDASPEDIDTFRRVFQNVAAKTHRPPSLNLDFLGDVLDMQMKDMLPKARFCSLGNDNNRIIDPLGDIYDCYEEAGHKERRIGTVSGGKLEFFPLKTAYAERHILNIPECLRCSMALFCGGGCPTQARLQKGSLLTSYCLQNKEFITQTLKAYYLLSKKAQR